MGCSQALLLYGIFSSDRDRTGLCPVSFMEENKQKLKLSFPSVSILPTLLISSIYNPVMLKYEWIPRERWVGSIIFC